MKMFGKKSFKRAILFVMTALLIFTAVAPVVSAKEYPNDYGKNGNIGQRETTSSFACYELNNHSGLERHVIMYTISQDRFDVQQTPIEYQFLGTFNDEDPIYKYEFFFDMGMLQEKSDVSTLEFGDKTVHFKQYQFGIYPGFYDFYMGGSNDALVSGNDCMLIKTLSPSWDFDEHESGVGSETMVEISEKDYRVYVLIGEKDWVAEVKDDFTEWSIETERHILKEIDSINRNNAEYEDNTEIEVNVPDENLDQLLEDLKNKEVAVEEETEEPPKFEEAEKPEPVEEQKDYSGVIHFAIWAVVLFLCGAGGYVGVKKFKERYR